MRIIDAEAGDHGYAEREWPVVRRIIHSTADFDFAGACRISFYRGAPESGVAALRRGARIIADVHGVTGLLSSSHARRFGNEIVCRISDRAVAEAADAARTTRSRAAMRAAAGEIGGSVVVVGNAPTALDELLAMVRAGEEPPALVVGLPVGFVRAAESKADLAASRISCITNAGRKGGSAAAAAAVNALYRLA